MKFESLKFAIFLLIALSLMVNALTDVKLDEKTNNEEISMMNPLLFNTKEAKQNSNAENSEATTFDFEQNIKNFNSNNNIIAKAYEKCINTCSITNV